MTPPGEDETTPRHRETSSPIEDNLDADDQASPDVPDVPGVVDWLLGGLAILGGLIFTIAGIGVFTVLDRTLLEEMVAAEDFQVEGMTEAEFVDVVLAMEPWLGAGLVITGLAMIAFGIAYIVHRRRIRARAARGEPTSDYLAHALLGAVVSFVTSFIPLSPIVGGGVAGYLERGESERTISVGAASGALMSAPFVVLSLFVAAGLVAGFSVIGDGGFGWMMTALVIVSGLFSLGFTVALGAAGGWIGGKLAE